MKTFDESAFAEISALIQHGAQERNWDKIDDACRLLDLPVYGAVSIERNARMPSDHALRLIDSLARAGATVKER